MYSILVQRNGSAIELGSWLRLAEYNCHVAVSTTITVLLIYVGSKPSLLFKPCKPFVLPPINNHLSPDWANANEWIPGILIPPIGSTCIVNGGNAPNCANQQMACPEHGHTMPQESSKVTGWIECNTTWLVAYSWFNQYFRYKQSTPPPVPVAHW